MFDSATCTAVGARWDAWLVAARQSPGAFGELPDLPGPDLAGALDQWDPQSRADDELIDRIGSWEKLRAWVDAGQLADIVELTARRRHADELERADHAARGGQGESGQLVEGPGPDHQLRHPRPRPRCSLRGRGAGAGQGTESDRRVTVTPRTG